MNSNSKTAMRLEEAGQIDGCTPNNEFVKLQNIIYARTFLEN